MSVRVAACQIDPEIGEVDRNLERIERFLLEAVHSGVELAVFPEAAVTGYAYTSLDEAQPVARRASAIAADRLSELAQHPPAGPAVDRLPPPHAQSELSFPAPIATQVDGALSLCPPCHLSHLRVEMG